jgi:hypothetical protein
MVTYNSTIINNKNLFLSILAIQHNQCLRSWCQAYKTVFVTAIEPIICSACTWRAFIDETNARELGQRCSEWSTDVDK